MIGALILAAGESSRMGRDKALLDYRGRTFLASVLASLREAGLDRVVVVLGHHAEEIRDAVELGEAAVVVNRDYRLGQTSSLQAGLRELDDPEVEAVVLCLVDHPAVSVATVKKLMTAFRETNAPAVIPTYKGRHGHPILIGRSLFDKLLSLDWGQGAATVIRAHRESTEFVEVEDESILVDVDSPEDYRRLTRDDESPSG